MKWIVQLVKLTTKQAIKMNDDLNTTSLVACGKMSMML